MQSGFSLQETMKILKDDHTSEIFESIEERLMNGQSVNDFISSFCPKEIRAYLDGFLLYMNLSDGLEAALHVMKEEKKEKQTLIKGCLYPCLLLSGMMCGIFLFATYILPSMLSLMNSLSVSGSAGYEKLQKIIRFTSCVMMIFFVAALIIVSYALSKKQIAETYRRVIPLFPDCLLAKSATRDFVRFFTECAKRNVSTRESLQMLKRIDEKPLTVLIAENLDTSLMKGESLEEAMQNSLVESALIRFIHIAAVGSECGAMMEGDLTMCTKRTEAAIQRFSRIVQLFSYTVIGIVLIFVYSVLMLPMSMLSQI